MITTQPMHSHLTTPSNQSHIDVSATITGNLSAGLLRGYAPDGGVARACLHLREEGFHGWIRFLR